MSKNVLITGCSSGIGEACAKLLKNHGFRVFAGVRKAADANTLQAMGFETLILDLDDSQSIQNAMDILKAKTNGQLFALVNNASFGQPGAIEDISRQAMRAQFETNLFGTLELTNHCLKIMRQQNQGRIIFISSILGLFSMPFRGMYCASKHALEASVDALRLELKNSPIQVSLVEPGPIESKFRDNALKQYTQHITFETSAHAKYYQQIRNQYSLERKTDPLTLPATAVANVVLKSLQSKKPKIRYFVTLVPYFLIPLKRLLPSRAFDFLISKISKKELKLRPN